jgi:transcriptional regulator with XRE-family HTH domain
MVTGASRLQAFLQAHGITQLAAATALGVSDPTVHDWVTGAKRPKAHHRQAIAVWTNGEVPTDSWLKADERAAAAAVRPFVSGANRRRRAPRTGTDG